MVAAWLWAIVGVLWAGRATYSIVSSGGPDVLVGGLTAVAVVALAFRIKRRGLVRAPARTVGQRAPLGS